MMLREFRYFIFLLFLAIQGYGASRFQRTTALEE
jgi:hypothetical protein